MSDADQFPELVRQASEIAPADVNVWAIWRSRVSTCDASPAGCGCSRPGCSLRSVGLRGVLRVTLHVDLGEDHIGTGSNRQGSLCSCSYRCRDRQGSRVAKFVSNAAGVYRRRRRPAQETLRKIVAVVRAVVVSHGSALVIANLLARDLLRGRIGGPGERDEERELRSRLTFAYESLARPFTRMKPPRVSSVTGKSDGQPLRTKELHVKN